MNTMMELLAIVIAVVLVLIFYYYYPVPATSQPDNAASANINLKVGVASTIPVASATTVAVNVPAPVLSGTNHITVGQVLHSDGVNTLTSINGVYRAIMQPDGNFCLYNGNTPVFASWQSSGSIYPFNKGPYQLLLDNTGDLLLSNKSGLLWSTGPGKSGSSANYQLVMQDDGNLVIYSDAKSTIQTWSARNSKN